MTRLLVSLLVSLWFPLLAWLAGYSFNYRGECAAFIFVGMTFVFGISYVCPLWANTK